MEHSPLPVLLINRHGLMVLSNAMANRLLGEPRSAWLKKPLDALFGAVDGNDGRFLRSLSQPVALRSLLVQRHQDSLRRYF